MTDKFYVGDTPLIELDCIKDITGASGIMILYIKPDKTSTGYVVASNVGNRYITFQVPDTTWIDQFGNWTFQSYMTIGAWTGHGVSVIQQIHELGR